MRKFRSLLTLVGAAFAVTTTVIAQPLGDTLYTVGTVASNTFNHQNYAVVLWQPIPAGLATGKKFAIYVKAGDASAVAPFVRRSIASLTTDPLVIAPLLNRAEGLGDDLFRLDEHMANLFGALVPPGVTNRAQRLAVVIKGAQSDPRNVDSLGALGRLHLGVNFCLGRAYAEPLTNVTTFEVREYNPATGQDVMVVGRVTLDPAAPTVLPAPGQPVALPEQNSFGNLNAKLRWATPPELRRLGLLQYGCDLYCVPRAAAEAAGFHLAPPTAAALRANPATRQVNSTTDSGVLPILAAKLFTATNVADFIADATTHFIADDNNGTRGGAGFHDGDEVYYFVTACDVLGRDGLVSPGQLVTMCSRVPPNPPRGLRVDNHYVNWESSVGDQRLRARWAAPAPGPGELPQMYFVYRWNDPHEIAKLGKDPTNHLIAGPLTLGKKETEMVYRDDGDGAPSVAADAGRTFWYTVRVAEETACGWNYSPHCAPVFGVLRDRTGPDAPAGGVNIRCCQPRMSSTYQFEDYVGLDAVHDADEVTFRFVCQRNDSEFEWVEFYAYDTAPEHRIGKFYFRGSNAVAHCWTTTKAEVLSYQSNYYSVPLWAIAGGSRLMDSAAQTYYSFLDEVTLAQQGTNHALALSFTAYLDCQPQTARSGEGNDCLSIYPYLGETGQLPPSETNALLNYEFVGYSPGYLGADWVDLYLNGTMGTNRLARFYREDGLFRFTLATNENIILPQRQGAPTFYLRAGRAGVFSDFAEITPPLPGAEEIAVVDFYISTGCGIVNTDQVKAHQTPPAKQRSDNRNPPCNHHTPVTGSSPGLEPVKPWFWLTPGTEEWRVYRRVDSGPLSLIRQGLASFKDTLAVTNSDTALPANAASVCYYAQLLDEHGNSSPVTEIGCIVTSAAQPAPAPMLAPPEAAGTPDAPEMKVSWFCPPAGVDRFEICIAAEGQDPQANLGPNVAPNSFSLPNPQTVTVEGADVSGNFGTYLTAKAVVFGAGANFTRNVSIQSGVKYTVFIRSVLVNGDHSPFSNAAQFTYLPPPVIPPPGVPWPARPLPAFNTNLAASVFTFPVVVTNSSASNAIATVIIGGNTYTFPIDGNHQVPGIRIGTIKSNDIGHDVLAVDTSFGSLAIHWAVEEIDYLSVTNPMLRVVKDADGKSLFGVALYRTQLTNAYYPRVSGDVIQVTPFMGAIAHRPFSVSLPQIGGGTFTGCELFDPFVLGYRLRYTVYDSGAISSFEAGGLFLLDTQPRLRGAAYGYMLIRFNEYGEVREAVPAGFYTEPFN